MNEHKKDNQPETDTRDTYMYHNYVYVHVCSHAYTIISAVTKSMHAVTCTG